MHRTCYSVLPIACLILAFCAALAGTVAPPATQARPADGPLSPDDQAILAEVAALTGAPASLSVERRPDGSVFVDAQGQLQAVLLVRLAADGSPVLRCVTTLEEARAFLAGDDPATAALLAGAEDDVRRAATALPAIAARRTPVEIVNLDEPGVGFNDPTPATPVAGNPGTSVGQQRLRAFEHAAAIWASALQSTVPIRIGARFASLQCTSSSGVLGSAGPVSIFSDFPGLGLAPGAPLANTWYPVALANKLAGQDLDPPAPGDPTSQTYDIFASFNGDLGRPGCLDARFWYYGFDGEEGQNGIDLVTVLLHEFAHGLGFISMVSLSSGENFLERDDVWNDFLFDADLRRYWREMNEFERRASAVNTGGLLWSGTLVQAAAPGVLQATPAFTVTAPPAIAGAYPVSPAQFGLPLPNPPLSATVVAARDPADSAGSATTDACSTLENAAAIDGNAALVDRGGCDFTLKARHAQAAGAVAVIVVDDQDSSQPPVIGGDDPTIGIPVVGLTRIAGSGLRAALDAGPVVVMIGFDSSSLSGADRAGRVQMYAPDPLRAGSSVSHFDVSALPNLLMEPSINRDIDQSLDLTDELLRDIGWFPDQNFNAVDDGIEINLHVAQMIEPTGLLRTGDVLTLTVLVSNTGLAAAPAVSLRAELPARLSQVSWSAVYSHGADGPAEGDGPVEVEMRLPAGGAARLSIRSVVGPGRPEDLLSRVVAAGAGLVREIEPSDNIALVLLPVAEYRTLAPFAPFACTAECDLQGAP